jgi:hypothetical protein
MAQGSTARVHEVSEHSSSSDNVMSRLAEHAARYVKIVAGYTVAVKAPYGAGHVCSDKDARALNWAYTNRASSVANSFVTRGKIKDGSDEEKIKYLTDYLNGGYSFTDDLGSEFSASLLETATDRLVFELGVKQGKLSGVYSDHDTTGERNKRAGVVKKVLTDPGLADKYEGQVRDMIGTILSERHAIQTRTARGNETELDIELA